MAEFVTVQIETEVAELQDAFIDKLVEELEAKGVVGYEPHEANLEIITGNSIAPMAANVAAIAAVVPPAIFRNYGTQLFNTPYNEGKAATISTKWKLLEEGGVYAAHTLEAGITLENAGLAFYVEKTTAILEGESEVTITLIAAERGTEYNGLTGTFSLTNSLNWVKEVTGVGESSGGENQETDEEYENRLKALLALQAPRPITANNFAEMALVIPTSVGLTETVGRATAIDGYNPATIEIEAKVNISKELTEVSTFTGVSLAKTGGAQSHPGSMLRWTGDTEPPKVLAANTTAVLKKGATEMEISTGGLKAEAKHKIEVIGKYEEERTVTVFVAKATGNTKITNEISAPNRTKIKEYLEGFRELNFIIYVEPASYNEIQLKCKVKVLARYVAASVKEAVKAAVESYLSPANWGNPTGQTTGANAWLNVTQGFATVRYTTLIGVIEAVPGVQYVLPTASGLSIGLAEAPGSKVADIPLVGPAPLPVTIAGNIICEVE